jgi:hypothetical protein
MLTAGIVRTVPRLQHLFEKGWAPEVTSEEYYYYVLRSTCA